ncbi:hypothetical protein [Gloeothece verrucosa]|uniref:Uncharacterized protein n=1 Tax=Gloeothece verrucosa (strain PCC 7822) TaxID=497965 RepID=E0UFQ3_GLOV7|nr:hypothetical protein [Gloeothece verrucosa]ADN13164.1 hypothetical protein Cyan7822_1157 [Gloeothece verrucosa PCC 7822]
MQSINLNKGIKLILLGLSLQIAPLIVWGVISKLLNLSNISGFQSLIVGFFALLTLILIIAGYVISIRGCGIQAKIKGYPFFVGVVLGLLSFLGISILVLLHPKENSPLLNSVRMSDNPFQNINLLRWFLALYSSAIISALGILFIGKIFNIDFLLDKVNPDQPDYNLVTFICLLIFIFWVFKDLKICGFNLQSINYILGFQNLRHQDFNLALVVSFFYFLFAGWVRIIFYYLSWYFPNYIENILNEPSQDLVSNPFLNFIIQDLIINNLLISIYLGLIAQKIANKFGIIKGTLITSLLFLPILFSSPSYIIGLIGLLLLTLLYYKTKTLMVPILIEILIGLFFITYSQSDPVSIYLAKSNILIDEYQKLVESQIGITWLRIAISTPFIIYFIYKNFPKQNQVLPYFANKAKAENNGNL